MNIQSKDKDNIVKIQKTIEKFRLPSWDELPSIYLYMDQVIELTTEYFEDISSLTGDEKILTAPMINNYIKLKAMPAPVKKRYGKIHLAYIFMISSLKQCMNISSMETVIPLLDDEEQIKTMYCNFINNHNIALDFLKSAMKHITNNKECADKDNTMLQVILASNLMKIFATGVTTSLAKKSEVLQNEDRDLKKESKKEHKKEIKDMKNARHSQESDKNEI